MRGRAAAALAGEVEFAVRDTGVCIAPDTQQLFFDAFSQVDSSATCQYGGTCLVQPAPGGHLDDDCEPPRELSAALGAHLAPA
jgi:hypothetical protein